jgi:gliding motility-associated lipoprotein GldH
MKKAINPSLLILVLFAFAACNSDRFYERAHNFEGSWNRYDTATFKVNISDTLQAYDFYFDIRNNNQYRFSNLYIFLHSDFPNGTISHDTLEFILAKKDGEWIGRGMGDIKENNIMVRKAFRFPVSGEYVFELEQGMRVENLTGIEDIGIRIEKADTK